MERPKGGKNLCLFGIIALGNFAELECAFNGFRAATANLYLGKLLSRCGKGQIPVKGRGLKYSESTFLLLSI
ncbi:hypothetical protein AGMMS49546_28540 [Spirochaetia bacterium]|nr:hypothetical protein AGMMS49546_28540 [Spirochaetia bacterium]